MADRPSLEQRVARLRTGVRVVSELGIPTIGHALAASARAELAARRARAAARVPVPGVGPGALREVEQVAFGARFLFEHAELEVVSLADDLARVSWGPGRVLPPYGLVEDPGFTQPAVEVALDTGIWSVRTAKLVVRVLADGGMTLGPPGDPERRVIASPERAGEGWRTSFAMRPGESFHGLGVKAAPLDLRGGRYRLWNRDPGGAWGPGKDPLYLSLPVLLAHHPDGDVLAFYENTTRATVDLRGEEAQLAFSGGALRCYVAVGSTTEVLDRYSALTGRPALPPRWALGYQQSRWGYRDATEIRQVVDGFADAGMPLSVIHLDIDYMDGFRVFTVDDARFPDLGALTAHAAGRGTRVVTIVDPAVKVDDGYDLYREGLAQDRFCRDADGRVQVGVVWPGRAAFPDFSDPAVRSWWASQYATLVGRGVAGIWHDMNEPATIAVMGDPTLPAGTRHDVEGEGGVHTEVHNVYGLLMNQAGYEGLAQARPEHRPFIVSRSGWAGSQRYAWNWTADVETSWDGLRQQVATLLGLGLSGIPFSGSDIGGFSGVPDDELYLRWLQFAIFVPFCRTHGVVGSPPREPWQFSPSVAASIGAWIRFRYRLLPYHYTLAHEAAATGTPVMRPLWWGTDGATGSDDAFLLGDSLLVAPVTAAGAGRRSVTLPGGSWTSLWRGGAAAGAHTAGGVEVDAPLERIPVLVRAGSVVTLDDGWAEADGACAIDGDVGASPGESGDGAPAGRALAADHRPRLLAFHCWPDAQGEASGILVDDEGDGFGPRRRDELQLEGLGSGGTYRLRWRRDGGYAPPAQVRVVLHGLEVSSASADGTDVTPVDGGIVCGPFDELRLNA
jgi:alpha-glucosidase